MNTEKEILVFMGTSEYHERLTFTERIPAEAMLNTAMSLLTDLIIKLKMKTSKLMLILSLTVSAPT